MPARGSASPRPRLPPPLTPAPPRSDAETIYAQRREGKLDDASDGVPPWERHTPRADPVTARKKAAAAAEATAPPAARTPREALRRRRAAAADERARAAPKPAGGLTPAPPIPPRPRPKVAGADIGDGVAPWDRVW